MWGELGGITLDSDVTNEVRVFAGVLQSPHRSVHAVKVGGDADVILTDHVGDMLDVIGHPTDSRTTWIDERWVED